MKRRCTAILLAGGSGKRMGTDTPKQFLELAGKPLLWYSLRAVERSEILSDCVLVAAGGDISYVRERIVERYGFRKVLGIAAGGAERYDSVRSGLEFLSELSDACDSGSGAPDYVFIHDCARPFLTEEILQRCYRSVQETGACVAAVPSKDTVKIADEHGFVAQTPRRSLVWNVQTPQVFEFELILDAYRRLGEAPDAEITDDASVVERFTDHPVRLVPGDYRNLKVTTPEDLAVAGELVADCALL